MEQEGCDRYRVHDAHAFQSCMVERKKESRGVETLPGMCVCTVLRDTYSVLAACAAVWLLGFAHASHAAALQLQL